MVTLLPLENVSNMRLVFRKEQYVRTHLKGTAAILAGVGAALAVGVGPVHAQEDPCAGSGQDYGQLHADLARQGALGKDRNPGQHQGYSLCR